MTGTSVFDGLLRPLSEAEPCGQSLEDTTVLAAFDAYQLFGQQIAIGTRRPGQKEDEPPTPPDWNEVLEKSTAALATSKDLRAEADAVKKALVSLTQIDTRMLAAGGLDATPNFDGHGDKEKLVSLRHQLKRIHEIVCAQIAARPDAAPGEVEADGNGAAAAGVFGAIRTREDAVRALDAVITFFQNTEPSSPVPLFIERAKRLIAKNFLDVLQDIVPDALNAAKAAGGIRDKK